MYRKMTQATVMLNEGVDLELPIAVALGAGPVYTFLHMASLVWAALGDSRPRVRSRVAWTTDCIGLPLVWFGCQLCCIVGGSGIITKNGAFQHAIMCVCVCTCACVCVRVCVRVYVHVCVSVHMFLVYEGQY